MYSFALTTAVVVRTFFASFNLLSELSAALSSRYTEKPTIASAPIPIRSHRAEPAEAKLLVLRDMFTSAEVYRVVIGCISVQDPGLSTWITTIFSTGIDLWPVIVAIYDFPRPAWKSRLRSRDSSSIRILIPVLLKS